MDQTGRWLLWGGYVALWTTLLVMPLSAFGGLPGKESPEDIRYILGKSLHVAAYVVMTLLSGWLQVPARFRGLLVFFLMVHATATEMIQLLFPDLGRTGDLRDVAFDHLGVMIGVLLSWNWWVKKEERG